MHRGRVELLDIAYWTLSEIRLGTSMLEENRDAFDRPVWRFAVIGLSLSALRVAGGVCSVEEVRVFQPPHWEL